MNYLRIITVTAVTSIPTNVGDRQHRYIICSDSNNNTYAFQAWDEMASNFRGESGELISARYRVHTHCSEDGVYHVNLTLTNYDLLPPNYPTEDDDMEYVGWNK